MNEITRRPRGMPLSDDGRWVWDGTRWFCIQDDDDCPPCPPSGPPGICPPFPVFPPQAPPWFSPPNAPWYPGANGAVGFGSVAPQNPIRGMFWWDGLRLWLFDGAVWVDVVDSAIKAGSGAGAGGGSGGAPIISSTPPPNPLPGTEWWNGTQLFLWDGTAWRVIGPGAAAGPTPTTTQTFAMRQTTGVAIGTGWTIVPFSGTPVTDTQSAYNAITHQYMPTKAGAYLFQARMNTGGSGGVAIVKNDSGTFTGNSASDEILGLQSSAAAGWMMLTGITGMNGVTDFVRLWAHDATGNFQNTGSNNVMTGWLLP